MKQEYDTILTKQKTTPADLCRWAQALVSLHQRIAPRFARKEPRHRALLYVQGILSDTARKNGWQLAEHAREATPYGMQRLLSDAVWDVDGVRDDLRAFALEQLGQDQAIVAIDESGFPKQGKHSAGVGRQYCGATGQVQNCQVGVFLDYVTAQGHCLIDRELYLPDYWCLDADRRAEVGIPEACSFQTKPELAAQMIERLQKAEVPFDWVVGDTVYGGSPDLRLFLEERSLCYILAVACNEPVAFQTPQGKRREEAAWVEEYLPEQLTWQRLSIGEGTKGPRSFDWATVPMMHHWQDDGHHFLLIGRSIDDPSEKRYYFVFAPDAASLEHQVKAIGCRWHIEEDLENTKDLGLDHYEVRSFVGWYRHITLVMLAYAFLVGIKRVVSLSSACLPRHPSPAHPESIPLTAPEIRHLLSRLIWPCPRNPPLVLAWSWWRRCHQRRASFCHTQRRMLAG